MRLVYKFNNYKEQERLLELSKISKNIYNQANYIIKKELRENNRWIRYKELNKTMKETKNLENEINYRLLKTQTSQQILKLLDKNWSSYFRSIKEWKKNGSKFKGRPRTPNYKKETNILIFTNQNSKIKDNKMHLYKNLVIDIPIYKNRDFTNFQQIRILNKKNYFEIEIIYEQKIKNEKLNYEEYSSIDLGINNLVAFVSKEQSILISGKPIKALNQYYNKTKAKLMSIKDKMRIKRYTKKLYKMERRRNEQIRDYLHKTSRMIVNYLIKNKIGNIVVGINRGWKDSVSIGKRNNQTFVSIPHCRLIDYLRYKCELVGIKLIEVEESYTSKCDGLVFEKVGRHKEYKGRRKERGLFQSSIGKLINADVNGALNILRKVVDDSVVKLIIDRGFLFNPVKIRDMFSDSLQIFLLKKVNNY